MDTMNKPRLGDRVEYVCKHNHRRLAFVSGTQETITPGADIEPLYGGSVNLLVVGPRNHYHR